MIRSPFKVQKHKRFDYSPRYYSERQERIDQSKTIYKQGSHQVDFRGTFHDMRKRKQGLSDKLPLLILLALIGCVYAYVKQGNEWYLYLSAICFPAYIFLRLKAGSATHRKPKFYKEEEEKEH